MGQGDDEGKNEIGSSQERVILTHVPQEGQCSGTGDNIALAFPGHTSDSKCFGPFFSRSLQNSKTSASKLQFLDSFLMKPCPQVFFFFARVCVPFSYFQKKSQPTRMNVRQKARMTYEGCHVTH